MIVRVETEKVPWKDTFSFGKRTVEVVMKLCEVCDLCERFKQLLCDACCT